jgi:hypothetical protein
MNPEKYLDNFNYKKILEDILKKHEINSMESNYNRHFQELKKKYLALTKELKNKSYFNEMPSYNEELLSSVVLLNTIFVEEAKQERFITFLKKKVVGDFQEYIKEYIFPYKDSDKEKMGNSAMIILKMESIEIATKAAEALNGKNLDKTHKITALTYLDYEKIEKMPKEYVEKKQLEFENANQWEKSNFTEMLLVESKDKITVGTVHFLKKTFNVNYTLPNDKDINEINWSPQGKYLVMTKPDKIILYGGENDHPITELDFHSHNYNISNDENYIVTFSGYPNISFENKETEEKKEEKKEGKKDEKKDEKKDGKKDGKRDEKKDKKKEEIKDEIKDEKKDEIKDEKKDKNKKNEDIKEDKDINEGLNDNNCDDIYLSNPVIKSALELGFDLNSVIEAWTICGDDKELVINYLLTENH